MNTELIEQSWNAIGERRGEMIAAFYERLFLRYPRYRALFPRDMGRQRQKMLETLALIAAQADAPALVRLHLKKVGARHAALSLTPLDFARFRTVLLEVLGEYAGESWDQACAEAWTQAFDQVVVPCMLQGMRLPVT